MNNFIWITWERQRRNRELSRTFNFKLYELSEISKIRNRLKKYILGVVKTIDIIYDERPRVVCCQNPSIILALFLVIIKPFFKFSICVDAHNSGLFPLEGKSIALNCLSAFIQKKSDLTIVTNDWLKDYVEQNGGRAYVLPDKIPSISILPPIDLKGTHNLLFVCTFAADEPFDIIFDAAYKIDKNIVIYVTGDFLKNKIVIKQTPKNLILMGFISDYDYEQMLNSVDAVIDLTTRENCLVCGAYESVAVGKPMILSNTEALRSYFTMGALFTDNKSESVVNSINRLISIKERLTLDTMSFKNKCKVEWEVKSEELAYILNTKF